MYSIQTPAQLSAYLKSLRKSRGLTQAGLGARLGVSAARIGAIEHNPSAVAFEQLLRLLHALGARIYLDTVPTRTDSAPETPAPAGEW